MSPPLPSLFMAHISSPSDPTLYSTKHHLHARGFKAYSLSPGFSSQHEPHSSCLLTISIWTSHRHVTHTPLKLTQPLLLSLCPPLYTLSDSQDFSKKKYTSPSLLIMSLKYILNIQNMYLGYDDFMLMLMISCLNYYCGII